MGWISRRNAMKKCPPYAYSKYKFSEVVPIVLDILVANFIYLAERNTPAVRSGSNKAAAIRSPKNSRRKKR
jgi:hypothetical protein